MIRGAREHNLRDISVELPRDRLIVFTGISGSGKSSLAFDTIYAEGQRRYVESLSAYARQFLGQMDKPDVDFIEGLSPAISIDQKSASRNPRSTVGTITEVYDYLRLLFARVGGPARSGHRRAARPPDTAADRGQGAASARRDPFPGARPCGAGGARAPTRPCSPNSNPRATCGRASTASCTNSPMWPATDADGRPRLDLARYEMHDIEVVVDRLVCREGIERRLTDSVEAALRLADGVVQIEVVSLGDAAELALDVEAGEILTFSQHLARPSDGKSFEELAPRNFSFNSPYGACPQCDGLGTKFEVDPDLVVPDPSLSLAEGALAPWGSGHSQYYERLLQSTAEELGEDFDAPWETLAPASQKIFLYGGLGRRVQVRYRNRYGRSRSYNARFEGVIPNLQRLHSETGSDNRRQQIEGYMREVPCTPCGGARLRPLPLAVTIDGRNINDICTLSIRDAARLFDEIRLSERDALIADQVLKELRSRLGFPARRGAGLPHPGTLGRHALGR